jgi:hypothetical protein
VCRVADAGQGTHRHARRLLAHCVVYGQSFAKLAANSAGNPSISAYARCGFCVALR